MVFSTEKLLELKSNENNIKNYINGDTYIFLLGKGTFDNKEISVYFYLYLGLEKLVHQITAAAPSVTVELGVTKIYFLIID